MTPPPTAPDMSLQDMRQHAAPLGDWLAQGWPGDDVPLWQRIAEVNRLEHRLTTPGSWAQAGARP